jgi:peptide/nickel transport system permease protein
MNSKLIAGFGLLAVLIGLSALAPILAPFDVDYSESIREERHGREMVAVFAPEAPSPRHPLGTDSYGYDMATNLLYGLPWTLAVVFGVALLRSVLGFAFGTATALYGRAPAPPRTFSPLAALPSFIVAYFILYPFTINPLFSAPGLLVFQCLVIGLLELPAVARSFAAKGETIAAMPFVEAARTSGASVPWIARWHIAPFLIDDFFESIPVQAVAAASFIAKLGFFSLFIGGTTLQIDPLILRSTKQELIGLMGHYNGTFPEKFWLFLGPFVGWLLILACAELIASGLRARTAKKIRLSASRLG